jgi:hypothetical protein
MGDRGFLLISRHRAVINFMTHYRAVTSSITCQWWWPLCHVLLSVQMSESVGVRILEVGFIGLWTQQSVTRPPMWIGPISSWAPILSPITQPPKHEALQETRC